jgi:hypothetical protein
MQAFHAIQVVPAVKCCQDNFKDSLRSLLLHSPFAKTTTTAMAEISEPSVGFRKERGKGKAVYPPARLYGKDAKLSALLGDQDLEGTFDPKKISKKQVFRPILSSPFAVRW